MHSVLRKLRPNIPPTVTGVTVSPKTNNLEVGATRQLNVTIEPSDIESTATYTSSDDEVASISESGLITAIGVGTATITVEVDGVSDVATVNVTEPETEG